MTSPPRRSIGTTILLTAALTLGLTTQAALAGASVAESRSGAVAAVAAPKPGHEVSGSLTAPPSHAERERLPVKERPLLASSTDEFKRDYDTPSAVPNAAKKAKSAQSMAKAAAAACNVSDFTSRTGSALVTAIKGSTSDCINTLFSLTGGNASSSSVSLTETGLEVQAVDFRRFTWLLPRVAKDAGVRIWQISPADEDLESVFSYLINRSS